MFVWSLLDRQKCNRNEHLRDHFSFILNLTNHYNEKTVFSISNFILKYKHYVYFTLKIELI